MVHEKHPEVELYIAGDDTDGRVCRSDINRLSCASQVHTCGVLDKETVRSLLYHCDALVLATRDETQGLVLLEAMSTGIPVVTTEAVPQNVRIDKGCIVAPIEDAKAIAEGMCEVMQLSAKVGEDVSRFVRERTSPSVIAQQIDAVMSECVSSHRNREA
jgi:glycosyltransferase involved in cell wall biosynthesis